MARAKLGDALKVLRKRNRWSLSTVSNMTGIPASTLSRIENNQMSPTYDMLLKLSRGLQIDIVDILSVRENAANEAPQQMARRTINRAGSGVSIDHRTHSLQYLASDIINKAFVPIYCEYTASSLEEFGEFLTHPGEEFLYILEGDLEFHTTVYAPTVLHAGDSVYFDSTMPHAYVAVSGMCRALSICTL